jgi:hypothetical protein
LSGVAGMRHSRESGNPEPQDRDRDRDRPTPIFSLSLSPISVSLSHKPYALPSGALSCHQTGTCFYHLGGVERYDPPLSGVFTQA